MKVPVLLIVFNRLEPVKKVFEQIQMYEPQQLFIAADGPRSEVIADKTKCQEVREWLVKNIDWNCEIYTLFRENNIGCGYGPSSAISWFFEHVDKGVILEDDCVPSSQFFDFAQEMLRRYEHDTSIMAVNGSNFQEQIWGDASYYFSMQNGPFCAWATWRRAWETFDFDLIGYTPHKVKKYMKHYNVSRIEIDWWLTIFRRLKKGLYGNSSWDYQFIFSIWKNQAKSIVPNVNLTSNIGFGPDATHTFNPNDVTANRMIENIYPLTHPTITEICRTADLYYHNLYYAPHQISTPWYVKLKRFVKKTIKLIIYHK